eukprot:GILI01032989.1.p2 GENE.GILI01032989.1~~GILI01032989.1.p2  ORF type:complete len:202 (-),score=53.75 GILI01032989.1:127-645(-)
MLPHHYNFDEINSLFLSLLKSSFFQGQIRATPEGSQDVTFRHKDVNGTEVDWRAVLEFEVFNAEGERLSCLSILLPSDNFLFPSQVPLTATDESINRDIASEEWFPLKDVHSSLTAVDPITGPVLQYLECDRDQASFRLYSHPEDRSLELIYRAEGRMVEVRVQAGHPETHN